MDFNLVNAPRKLLPVVKAKLRQKIPMLNERQLKRLEMDYCDALIDELEDFKFIKGFTLLKKVIQSDQQKVFHKKTNYKLLEKIFNAIKKIEEKAFEDEIIGLLDLVKEVWDVNEDFDWLIEVLLVHSTDLVSKNHLEGSRTDTMLKYIHGTVVSERLKWYRASVVLLESAFHIATQHEEWKIGNDKLCVLISYQLSDSLIKLSRQVREDENNVVGALKLSRRSLQILRKYISENNINYEIDAEFEHAACHYENKTFKNSLQHYGHVLTLAEYAKLKKKVFEILIKMGECHKSLDDFTNYENYLLLAREVAGELKLTEFVGDVNVMLGRHFIQVGNFEKISLYLKAAIQCFINARNSSKLTSSKLILAEFKAKSNFNALIDTILRCDKATMGNNRDFEKLVLWYDRKYPLTNRYHDFYRIDEEDPNIFIKKFYDPDEVIKIQ